MVCRIMFILQRLPLTQEDKDYWTPYGQSFWDIFNRTGSIWKEKWRVESRWEESEEGSEHKPVASLSSTLDFNFVHNSSTSCACIPAFWDDFFNSFSPLKLNDLTCHVWRGCREVLQRLCRKPAFLVSSPAAQIINFTCGGQRKLKQ